MADGTQPDVQYLIDAACAKIGRKRDRTFVRLLLEQATRTGSLDEQTLTTAALMTYQPGERQKWTEAAKKKAALYKAKNKLENHDIREAIRDLFELTQDFSILDGTELMVKHMKGEITKEQVVVVDGEVQKVEVKVPPNYAALKDFLAMTLPQPAKKIALDARIAHATVDRSTPADILPRAIGAATVEDAT